jgi:RHS repeat-associated protein
MNSNLKRSSVARAVIAATVLLFAGSASGDGGGDLNPRTAPPRPTPITLPIAPIIGAPEGSGSPLAGSWDVTSSGAFTYSILLEVPEGRNGMQPSLSLSYSGGRGNGLLGAGWSLSGLSTVTRCDKTLATEGVVDGVDYSDFTTDNNGSVDRFCLDGQKLVAVGGVDHGDGSYGRIDTEYRTEVDIFARIISTGSSIDEPLGPDKFIVYLKSGVIREYVSRYGMREQSTVSLDNGVVTDSTVHLGQVPVAWVLSTERDRSGNEVRYSYLGSNSDPETRYLPSQISYTYNTQGSADAQQAHRFVDFHYQERPDPEFSWKSGVYTRSTRLLESISMSAPNPAVVAKVWEYKFGYGAGTGSGRSLLTSVKRCGALGGCTRAKEFGWYSSGFPTFTATTIAAVPLGGDYAGYIPPGGDAGGMIQPITKVFDADGDGLDDVIYYPGADYQPGVGPATEYDPQVRLGYRDAGAIHPLGNEFPAKVRTGYLSSSSGESTYFLSNSSGRDTRPVDIDGDGAVELWTVLPYTTYGAVRHPVHWQSQPPIFVPMDIGVPETDLIDGDVALTDNFLDLDGDGLLDRISGRKTLQYGMPELRYRMNLGGTSFTPGAGYSTGLSGTCGVRVTDTDGDGRGEAVFGCGADGSYKMSLPDVGGAGGGVHPLATNVIAPGPGVHFGDFNGDGLEDALLYEATDTSPAKILWNTGNGYVPSTSPIALPRDTGWAYAGGMRPFVDEGIRVVDVNGDGRADIVSFHKLPTPDITVLFSKGTGQFTRVDLGEDPGFRQTLGGWATSQLGDFNGDGRPDIVTINNGNMVVLEQSPTYPDRLLSVKDELTPWAREEIKYSNEWSDNPDEKSNYTCAYPLHCIRHGFPVVRSVLSRAHLVDPSFVEVQTGARWLNYSYEDPVSDLRGRGFLGFGTFHVWDPHRPMETITKFDHRTADSGFYPGASRPRSVTTVVPIMTQDLVNAGAVTVRARVTRSEYAYSLRSLNSGLSHAVLSGGSVTKEWEQPVTIDWFTYSSFNHDGRHVIGVYEDNSYPLREVETSEVFDNFDNLINSSSWTTGGVESSVINGYDYSSPDWLVTLQRLHCVINAEADPGQLPVTRCEEYTHDALGRLDTILVEGATANPDIPLTTTFSYDDLGLPTSIAFTAAGVLPRTAHIEYAPSFPGQPDERVFPSQFWAEHDVTAFRPSSWIAYHPGYGVPVATMDVNGVQTQIQCDDLGRTVTVRHDGDADVTMSYSGRPDLGGGINGTVTKVVNGLQTSKVVADALGRTIQELRTGFDGSMVETNQKYDILGRLVQSAEPISAALTRTTSHTYDSLNRLLETVLPDSHTLVTEYPSMFMTHSFDASNNETYITRDVNDRVVNSTNILNTPASGTEVRTSYAYAPFDQVASVTDDVGHVTKMQYDVRGRRVQLDDPDQGTTTFNYNAFGDLYKSTHAASGQVKDYQHDDLGRLTWISDHDGLTNFVWDESAHGIGRLASTLSPDSIATLHRYDSAGRVAGMDLVDDLGGVYSTDMDYMPAGGPLSGQPRSLSYPNVPGRARFVVENSYNSAGYVAQIKGLVTPGQAYQDLWTVHERNRDMALLHGSLGNQIDVRRGYDDLTSRIATLTGVGPAPGSNPVVDLDYGYSANGLVTSRSDHAADRGERFTYDSLLRLRTWSLRSGASSLVTAYSYDTIGNLLEVDEDQNTVESNVYGLNGAQPHTLTDHHDVVNNQHDIYAYDTLGRQVSGGGRTIGHSAFDLPRRVTKNGSTWGLLYDAFGHRVKKTGPDGTTIYVGDLYELRETASGIKHVFHVEGTDGPVAEVIYDGVTTTPSYVVSDPLGSTSVVLDAAGTVTDRFFFQPFGKRINADGTAFSGALGPMKHGFTGQESEEAYGLINFRGRMYDPALKRFISADPLVTYPGFGQNWNPYSYALNSPLSFNDPSGFEVCTLLGQCYPTSGGGGGGIAGDNASDYTGTGPFAAAPIGSTGNSLNGAGGWDVAKSDSDGSRQAGSSTESPGAGAITLPFPVAVGFFGGGATTAGGALGAGALGAVLAPITAFLCITFYDQGTIVNNDAEIAMLAASKLTNTRTKTGTGTHAIPKTEEKQQTWYVVRVQAQGGGLEKSVAIRQGTPITVMQGLAALAQLQAQLTPRELRDRSVALDAAASWIANRPPYGAGPPGKSGFTNPGKSGNDARVDVEILGGVNFSQ